MSKMKLKPATCGEERDHQAPRNWWEPPHVIYGFSNPRVRSMLERLVGTHIVRVTDGEFMLNLQKRRREDHEERVRKRIHDREMEEVEREKRLILEEKMPVEAAPKELKDHPVFRITLQAKKIMEEKRLIAEKKRRRKKIVGFNYALLEGKEEEDLEDHEISSCLDDEMNYADRERRIKDREQYISEGPADYDSIDYDRIKYEDPFVQDLMELEGVDEIYGLADEIVGPLTGKACGGLLK